MATKPLLTRGLLTRLLLQITCLSRNHSGVTTVEPFTDFSAQSNQGIEIGNRTAPHEETEKRSTLVLATYNIRYAVGRRLVSSGLLRKVGYNFPRRRSEAVARNIQTAARAFSGNALLPPPDILALQEADKETGRAGGQHVAARLAEILRLPYVHVGAGIPRGIQPKQREWWLNFEEQIALRDAGDTGVALLSRIPLEEITRIDLPWHDCAWRPRLALGATIKLGEEKLRLFNAHIDPHGPLDNQHQQIEAVLEHADRHDGPSVILGDFNTLSKQKAVEIRRLMESRGYTTPFQTGTATWRGAGLRFHADWIFVRGVRVTGWGVAKPLNVSDHLPIWAEIEPNH
ncbi:MAG TPA: endonuclease/exonuclease/phosphatase family protein [Pyrinomonadaceae bacterium]|nr:endonuclease/exonuclease/phosphatase family protein [Pyrinomonadaceae bacterium]